MDLLFKRIVLSLINNLMGELLEKLNECEKFSVPHFDQVDRIKKGLKLIDK